MKEPHAPTDHLLLAFVIGYGLLLFGAGLADSGAAPAVATVLGLGGLGLMVFTGRIIARRVDEDGSK